MRSVLIAALLAAAPLPLAAHTAVGRTVPAEGATVAEVPELRVPFDGPMRITFVELTRDGVAVPLAREGGFDPVAALEAAPEGPLAPGAYLLDWRGLAADGHPMTGTLRFTVAP